MLMLIRGADAAGVSGESADAVVVNAQAADGDG